MLTREQWAALKPILDEALDLPPGEQAAYLDRACAAMTELRGEAERLLNAVRLADGAFAMLDSPAAELAAPLLDVAHRTHDLRSQLEPGTQVGKYTIERRLGSGGMGVVYLARDTRLDRMVALKLLAGSFSDTDDALHRFEREARAASRLDHPNVETVYDIGESDDGRRFIAIAYYDGETLERRIARGPLDESAALDLARQIADGLAATHARGIIHRDIKPSNVIVTSDGVAKIVDFGTAVMTDRRLTLSGATHGTVAYMSPEQTIGAAVDGRTDLWSLGVVLYEMLTGIRPFDGQRADAVLFAIRYDDPTPVERHRPDLSPAVADIVRRCLVKDPDHRHATAAELRDELARLAMPSAPPMHRRKWAATAAAAASVLVAASALLLVQNGVDSPNRVPLANTIAVMPPLAASDDTTLVRLGRELAITLSASLDGIGDLRTVPAWTVLERIDDSVLPLSPAARVAMDLSASRLLHGSLVRNGRLVRLELGLFSSADLDPLARVSITAPADDLTALSDSAVIALLRQIWRGQPAPIPNAPGLTTRSVAAWRAYIDGELAFSRADYPNARMHFEQAFAADSSFTFAYWRSLYPRIYEGSRPDSAILARIVATRDRLPDPDRLLLDAYAAVTLTERLSVLRSLTTRFPEYWPGWFDYGNALVHDGPFIGSTYADAREALERVVALNPDLATAWVHLHWIASLQRDTIGVNRTIAALERWVEPNGTEVTPDNLLWGHAFQELLRTGGEFRSDIPRRMAAAAIRPQRAAPQDLALRFLGYGFAKAQLQRADAVLGERAPPRVASAQWMSKAFAWAARGAWDSALASAGQWVRLSDDPRTRLRVYGLSVLGVAAGTLDASTARRRRPDLTTDIGAQTADYNAELAWLDGVLAYAEGDVAALAGALRRLRSSGAAHAGVLTESLGAFHRYATGDRRGAARALAELEWKSADQDRTPQLAEMHPYVTAIHRPAAARWTLDAGDTLQALRLLRWHEAILRSELTAPSRVIEPLALFERARLEESLGRVDDAGEHYGAFLERYDLAPPIHQRMVTEARAALERLSRSAM